MTNCGITHPVGAPCKSAKKRAVNNMTTARVRFDIWHWLALSRAGITQKHLEV